MTAPLQGPASTEELLRFERLVSGLSAAFINMPAANVDAAIGDALRRIVEALGVDRSTLSIVLGDGDWLETYQSWAVEGVARVPKGVLPLALPWVLARARAGLPIVFACLDDLPEEASIERAWYGRHGLRSHVGLPVIVAGELFAILGFGTLRSERAWPAELLDRLKVVADMFGSALARKRAHEDVQQALGFERLLVDISASLVKQRSEDADSALRRALRAIGEFLAVDRAMLWTRSSGGMRFEATHAWTSEGASSPPAAIDEAILPTVFRSVANGAVVALSDIDDLPSDAHEERAALRGSGTRSLLAVPLIADGHVVGALSLSAVREVRAWPVALTPRVQLIGEVLASVITRRRAAQEVTKAQVETAQYRERLAHLARVHTVGEMSAAIAHEVNQPLMAIENYAQAAARRLSPGAPVDGAKIQELLGKIGAQAARAGDVLKRLRSIVRKHESEACEFDLGALVADTMGLVEMESRLQDVRVEIAVPPALPPVFADEVQIQQVLVNLARNGIEAMDGVAPRDKVLRVEVSAPAADGLCVRVADRGRGISAADAAHLFEPFYSTKPQGLGIGLAICRSIVEAHGGRLALLPSEGRGATFQFTLPVDLRAST